MPSGTGSPAPSRSRPRIRTARGSPSGTSEEPMCSRKRPIERNGPDVCDGAGARAGSVIVRLLERGGAAPAEHDVEAEPERPGGLGQVELERADQTLASLLVADRVEDRIEREERIAREVHLGDEPIGNRAAEDREVDVGGAPGVRMVLPRVRPGLDGDEPVFAVLVGQAP